MAAERNQATATVAFEYVWDINRVVKATSTYTTTYTNSPGFYTLWAMIVNSDMIVPSQTEIVGIPFTLASTGAGNSDRELPITATRAMHSPTSSILPLDGDGMLESTFVDIAGKPTSSSNAIHLEKPERLGPQYTHSRFWSVCSDCCAQSR